MIDISWLEESTSDDRSLVGGKVANLNLLACHYNVPPGYCVTTNAFRVASSAQPRRLPPPIKERIASAYEALCARMDSPSVAVRSSAVDEDNTEASFAGQHDTYLNVSGADAVVRAVDDCWESAFSDRALAYRRQQGLSSDRIGLAVLVQQLVPSDVAAVVFSANPVSGNRCQIVINASWGLGESIVSGTVTPDTYIVDKASRTVLSRTIADKQRMIITTPGGTREADVPRLLRQRPALDTQLIDEIAALAASLEARMGWPVDVECAVRNGRVYLLQCRPITILPTPAGLAPVTQSTDFAASASSARRL